MFGVAGRAATSRRVPLAHTMPRNNPCSSLLLKQGSSGSSRNNEATYGGRRWCGTTRG